MRRSERNRSPKLLQWSGGGGAKAAEGFGFCALSGPPVGIFTAQATAYPGAQINLSRPARYPVSRLDHKMALYRISAGLFRVEGLIGDLLEMLPSTTRGHKIVNLVGTFR